MLTAECSVMVEGELATRAAETAAVELAARLGVRLLAFWRGSLPAGLDPRLWRTLDVSQGSLVALARAAAVVTGATMQDEAYTASPT